MLANIHLLAHTRLVNSYVKLVDARQRAWLVHGETKIHGEPGDKLSLIPLAGDVHVGSSTGLRWSLNDEVLEFGKARGISNELTAKRAAVTVKRGLLLCVHWERGRVP